MGLQMLQFLSSEGKIVIKEGFPSLAEEELKRMYELMVLVRIFDQMALKLQREGRILTYASCFGQEASQVGSALAFEEKDWFTSTYRDHGVWITRGFPLENLYLYWAGDERGMKIPQNLNALPPTIPIASQIPQAVGIALAQKFQKKKSVVLTYFGDGATSKGDFYEGLNFAAVFQAPCIFICQNNQWAISVPLSRQTKSETLAQKALACGIEGVLVDGNDILAVYKATKEAVEKARAGKGPTFIECYTYRLESHTTADDWRRYRSAKEVEKWQEKEPLKRFRNYLAQKQIWNQQYEDKIQQEVNLKVKKAIEKFESFSSPSPEDIFEYIYEKKPTFLEEEIKEF
jgi:pyruvate dehydrogenase E1 component alpha subunit